VDTVGVTSGASAPERLVDELVAALRDRGATEVREVEVVPEDVHFALPGTLRRDAEVARGPIHRDPALRGTPLGSPESPRPSGFPGPLRPGG
jgi:hypothetical protein